MMNQKRIWLWPLLILLAVSGIVAIIWTGNRTLSIFLLLCALVPGYMLYRTRYQTRYRPPRMKKKKKHPKKDQSSTDNLLHFPDDRTKH